MPIEGIIYLIIIFNELVSGNDWKSIESTDTTGKYMLACFLILSSIIDGIPSE